MKKYLKKLLVVAMALMPSLSINTFAQPSGNDPEDIPVTETPSPNPNPIPAPRIMSIDPDEIPVIPAPDPHPNPGPNPGPRIASAEPDEIPIKSPTDDIPRPRMRSAEPDDIPIIPAPGLDPGTMPRLRNGAQAPHCYHINGVVYIDADATITFINATVTRYNDNQVWSDANNSNTLSIITSADAGEYLLNLTLSNGQSYIGKYIIE